MALPVLGRMFTQGADLRGWQRTAGKEGGEGWDGMEGSELSVPPLQVQ